MTAFNQIPLATTQDVPVWLMPVEVAGVSTVITGEDHQCILDDIKAIQCFEYFTNGPI